MFWVPQEKVQSPGERLGRGISPCGEVVHGRVRNDLMIRNMVKKGVDKIVLQRIFSLGKTGHPLTGSLPFGYGGGDNVIAKAFHFEKSSAQGCPKNEFFNLPEGVLKPIANRS